MQPLHLNIRLLRLMILWPDDDKKVDCIFLIKHMLTLFTLMPSATSSCLGVVYQFNEADKIDIDVVINQLIGLTALAACIYMCECFLKSVEKIRNLTIEISDFGQNFKAQNVVDNTEKTVQLFTKGIILYGILGNLCYAAFPMVTKSNCEKTRQTSAYERDHDPCGLILRIWYPFVISQSPLFEVAYLIQAHTCLVTSLLVLTITMMLVGLLMHGIALLKDCGRYIQESCEDSSPEKIMENVNFCIRYHIAIIQYSTNVVDAFSAMMIVHVTVTSFEISILCFEIIMVDSIMDSMRFGMHLFGWLVLLFLVCFFGQGLIDESTKIGIHAYSCSWYNAPVKVQKDIQLMILRSQKPLTLSAASLGVMSLESYLGVISTAYSYFTLLLNMKE